jgi:hypothetical protein
VTAVAWEGSTRRRRLPPDWPAITARILERDGRRCYLCGGPGGRGRSRAAATITRDGNLAAILYAVPSEEVGSRRRSSSSSTAAASSAGREAPGAEVKPPSSIVVGPYTYSVVVDLDAGD